jgi:hypothetical protein
MGSCVGNRRRDSDDEDDDNEYALPKRQYIVKLSDEYGIYEGSNQTLLIHLNNTGVQYSKIHSGTITWYLIVCSEFQAGQLKKRGITLIEGELTTPPHSSKRGMT